MFGTIVSSSGSAFTWAGNSRENRLTPFANDPVSDPTAEAIYLRDEESGVVWGATPGPLPRRPDDGRWIVRHAAGVTRFQHAVAGLAHELAVFVAPDDPVKLAVLTLTNTGESRRRISTFGYVEWCLGPPRAGDRRFVVTEMDGGTGAILARNAYNTEFAEHVAFWRATAPCHSHTADRTEFIGRNRTLAEPAALFRERLGGRTGAGLDPCGALQVDRRPRARRIPTAWRSCLDRGATAPTPSIWPRATPLWRRRRPRSRPSNGIWDETLGAVQVHTPDDSFDLIVNRWLLYQTLALPHLGTQRTVSARRRIRFPRSAPGRARAAVCAARPVSRAPAPRGVAAVRRGRRPALVASAERTRNEDALLG